MVRYRESRPGNRLVARLFLAAVLRSQYRFFPYAGNEHFFSGEDLELAVERDVAFFRDIESTTGD